MITQKLFEHQKREKELVSLVPLKHDETSRNNNQYNSYQLMLCLYQFRKQFENVWDCCFTDVKREYMFAITRYSSPEFLCFIIIIIIMIIIIITITSTVPSITIFPKKKEKSSQYFSMLSSYFLTHFHLFVQTLELFSQFVY